MDTKKAKKSKHGKKNWRKNIDVTDIESKMRLRNKDEIIEDNVKGMKDDKLFTFDYTKSKEKFSGKKRERTPKKLSIVEQRKVKRIIDNNNTHKQLDKEDDVKEEIVDLWADENINSYSKVKKKVNSIHYPVVPIPHPGQSYNPSKDDLSKLLYKVVELNRPLEKKIIQEEEEKKINKGKAKGNKDDNDDHDEEEDDNDDNEEEEEEEEKEESSEEEDDIPCTHPVSNNPPTLDNRLTRKEKRRKEEIKVHKLKQKQAIKKKQVKIDISNEKSSHRIEKERKKAQQQEAVIKSAKEAQLKKMQSQYSHGIIDDKDLLEEFIVKKDPTPLRKMKSNRNYISERFDNIVKRNVIGKDNQNTKKINRKLNKYAYMDITGSSFKLGDDNGQLQMFN